MFVMSELSLPWNMLEVFLKFSADNQVGFVAGMEYLNLNNTVYNFVVTCLPFEKNHVKDCLPIFRLKKHYAPIEKSVLERESFSLPVDKNKWFDMFKWKGMCFTVLNCFELTNVRARASFVSKIDTLITIAYNKDITYYDNLAESTSRDLYCYVVLNNVSQHGSSQIVAPKKQENKILLKVIRGTTEKNQTTIETADLDIRGLRLFQKYGENNKDEFKPLPAGFNRNVARLNNV